MLNDLCQAYPTETVLTIAKIRNLLNFGQRELAEQLAAQIYNDNVEVTFERAENFVQMILDGETFGLV